MPIQFDQTICGDLAQALSKEWLETNGRGGYASSTIVGTNTRKYHGLLVAALRPPGRRSVLLSQVQETLVVEGRHWHLSTNLYPGVVQPQGYLLQAEFRLDPFPTAVSRMEDWEVEKRIFMPRGRHAVVLAYTLVRGPAAMHLYLRPMLAFRDAHATTQENPVLNGAVDQAGPGIISVQPYESLPRLFFTGTWNTYFHHGFWYRRFLYPRELEMGLTGEEDLFCPLEILLPLTAGRTAYLVAAADAPLEADPAGLEHDERQRRAGLGPVMTLGPAADQFRVQDADHQETVVAGYHWFGARGRDAMIALRGLFLETGQHAEARQVLLRFAQFCAGGMIPNCLPDTAATLDYHTMDAPLWFVLAIWRYGQTGGCLDPLLAAARQVIHGFRFGTRYNIRMDSDGLICGAAPGIPLTWMDAKVGDWVVTPRPGKPIEVQALWYNALRAMAAMDPAAAPELEPIADRCRASVRRQFWLEEGYLADVVDGDQRDRSIRPNQVMALGLPYPVLDDEPARRTLGVIEEHLLTPYGLRTLSPRDPRYQGRCAGDQRQREAAYHNGTVWAWLLGPYLDAARRFGAGPPRLYPEALRAHLGDAGLGTVSEIFDGDAPHWPRGCIAQAISVAEWLRVFRAMGGGADDQSTAENAARGEIRGSE